MYYRLQQDYILRGWKKMNAVLVKRPYNHITALKPGEFNLLMLCDGETNFSELKLTDEEQKALAHYLEEEIVKETDVATPLDENQLYRFHPNRFVKSVFWSITGRCNFRCRHCYMDAPEGALGELSHEEAISLIDQMAECGVLKVDITGGEPFVRKDFWELIDRLLSYGITIGQIYTNGWLLTEDVLDKFEQRNLKPSFSFSFDGVGWHDWMRGVNGAEEAAIRALTLCKERGFRRNVEMCVHQGNKGTIRDTVNYLRKIGVPSIKFGNVCNTELWKQNSEGNEIEMAEYVEAVLDYLPHFYADGMPTELLFGSVVHLHRGKTDYEVVAEKHDGTEKCLDCHLCGAVRYSCYVTPEGRLLPCMPMTACKEQELFARFQDMGLRKGLSDSFYMEIADKRVKDLLAVNEKCNACPHKLKCAGGCRAIALEKTGDLLGSDPDQCFLWENGYVERIHEVADAAIAKYCKENEE